MYTVIEIPSFVADADETWSPEERGAFCAWLAANPEAGDVILVVAGAARSGGASKVRASGVGSGLSTSRV